MFKKLVIATFLTICSSSALAAIDINLDNQTDLYGTGKFGFICSAQLGQKGIVQPHSNFVITKDVLTMFCAPNCQAHIYFSKDCSGSELATVDININSGVTKIVNHQANEYEFDGGGTNITIKPISGLTRLLNMFK